MKWNINFKNEKVKLLVQTYGKAAAAIVLVIVLCMLFVKLAEKPQDTQQGGETESQTESQAQTETTAAEQETVLSSLRKDAYPEIQALMEAYFAAKLSCDVEALGQLVYPMAGYTVEGLENDLGIPESEAFRRVEDYRNIVCYTKPGLLADTYVVWVYYETKYVDVETAAPCMFKAYVCTDDTGVYIYNGAIEGEISNYLDEASKDEDVVALVNSVNQQLAEACGADEGLKNIYDILWGTGMEAETEPETSSAAE